MKNTRIRAFTLVEVLITSVLLLIAAAIVVPMGADRRAAHLRAAAQILVADFEYAQVQSFGLPGDPVAILFESDGSGYGLHRQSDLVTPITEPVTRGEYRLTFGTGRGKTCPNVSITSLTVGGDDELNFTSTGALDQGTDAQIQLSCSGKTLTVTIDPFTGECSIGQLE